MDKKFATRRCGVFGCPKQPPNTIFFKIPHPSKGHDVCKTWLANLGNPEIENMDVTEAYSKYNRVCVCERHFKKDDFMTPNRLKKNVVPTLYLPKPSSLMETIDVRPGPSACHTTYDIDIEFKENEPFNPDHSPRKRQSPFPLGKNIPKRVCVESGQIIEVPEHVPEEISEISEEEKSKQSTNGDSSATAGLQFLSSSDSHAPPNDPNSFEIPSSAKSVSPKGKRKSPKLLSLISATRKKSLSPKAFILYEKARQLRRKAAQLRKLNISYRKRLLNVKNVCQSESFNKLTNSMTSFQKRFFESQLKNVTARRKGKKFTLDNKVDAIVLWKSSPKMYKLLYNLFSLPSVSTLRALLSKVPINPGICDVIFKSCEQQMKSLKNRDKLCVLLFDEMALQPHLAYDTKNDCVIGFEDNGFQKSNKVADHVAVFMLRGIFRKWKQPVAFSFCKSSQSAADIARFYKEIVDKAAKAGLQVLSSICDQGTNNVRAVNLLLEETRAKAIREGKQPRDGIIEIGTMEVVHLYDPPHLLKSLRNNLLTKNLKFSQNNVEKTASWEHIIKAYNIDKSNNIRVMKKLNDFHVIPQKIKKMKVATASQVFSETVASAIKYCAMSQMKSTDGISKLDESALDTATLLEFIDKLFDSVNGGFIKTTPGKLLRKNVSGKSSHLRVWLDAIKVLETMQFVPNKPADRRFPPCLKGWIHTIRGFIILRSKLLSLGYNFFPARAFNQDPLENFFGQIRQYGARNINPTCENFIPYFKSLLVKNFSPSFSKHSNCEDDFVENNLVSLKYFLLENELGKDCSVSSRWNPPNVILSDKLSDIEVAALGYVSGFVVNQLLKKNKDCNICSNNILHQGEEPDEYHHALIELREYDPDVKKLKYANVTLIKNLLNVYQLLSIYIPSAINADLLKQRVISVIREKVNLNFNDCSHKDEIENFIFDYFTRIFLFNYIKKLNNIILGKNTPFNPNQMEKQLIDLYNSRKRKK